MSNAKNYKLIIYYVAFGPLLAAFIISVLSTALLFLPEIYHDPSNVYGHDRVSDFLGMLGLIVIFAYLLGAIPALVSSLVHLILINRFAQSRIRYSVLIAFITTSVMCIEFALLSFDPFSFILIAPVFCSAMLLALGFSRQFK